MSHPVGSLKANILNFEKSIRKAFLILLVCLVGSVYFLPVVVHADVTSYTTSGADTFTVPYYVTFTAEVWGGGGGGGGVTSVNDPQYAGSGSAGGQSHFDSTVYGNGGGGGGRARYNTSGSNGSGGTASGGDTNTTGSNGGSAGGAGANGGAGGSAAGTNSHGNAGTAPGGGGSGGYYYLNWGKGVASARGGGGGGGGYSTKAYSLGDLTPGASIDITVGGGGAGGDYYAPVGAGYNGGSGAVGRVTLTYTLDTTAPTPNAMTYATSPDDASATSIDMTSTTGTDSYDVEYSFTYTACSSNAGTGGTSSGWQTSTSYTDTGLQVNKCYGYTVQARDAVPNTGTASVASEAYTAANTPSTPSLGTPTASTLTLTHAENSNPTNTTFAVQLLNSSPSDGTWDNQYVDATGNPSASAVWLTDAQLDSLVINGLNSSTYYEARSKARNGDNDETAFSATTSNSTIETDPPTPDPMTFATAPDDVSTTSIDMLATTASDTSTPIEYNFSYLACVQDAGTGGTSSGWQTSTSYTDTGLQVNKCYGYTVQARDSVLNTTASSTVFKAYTAANTPGTPTLSSPSETTAALTNNANSNPATTTFAIQLLNTSPVDAIWNNQYVDATGNPSASAVWLTDAQLDGLTVQGLADGTYYEARSKARNGDGDETIFSGVANATTEESTVTRINLLGDVRLGGVRFR